MWLIGLMGMATSFFECSLAQLFKRAEPSGNFRGGPAYYLTHGIGQKWLAVIYSILLLITFGFGFNAVQAYVVATSVHDSFGVPTWVTGLGSAPNVAAVAYVPHPVNQGIVQAFSVFIDTIVRRSSFSCPISTSPA